MEMTGRLSPSCTTKERLVFTASSSKPYSGSMAVREEDVSDGAGMKVVQVKMWWENEVGEQGLEMGIDEVEVQIGRCNDRVVSSSW